MCVQKTVWASAYTVTRTLTFDRILNDVGSNSGHALEDFYFWKNYVS